MTSDITPEMRESVDIHNDMISRANQRIEQLMAAGFDVTARLGGDGVTITKRRRGMPEGRGYESMTTSEIIVPRDRKWTGGDSSDAKNFKVNLPHIAR